MTRSVVIDPEGLAERVQHSISSFRFERKRNEMNRAIFLISAFLLATSSCKQTGISPVNCREGICTYTFQEHARLRVLPPVDRVVVAEGENLVFSYEYVQDEHPGVHDDEYIEHIWFEVDPDAHSFQYVGEEMFDAQATFFPDCECQIEIVPIINGQISGERLSKSRWEVTVDVEFDWNGIPQERTFTEEFELATE